MGISVVLIEGVGNVLLLLLLLFLFVVVYLFLSLFALFLAILLTGLLATTPSITGRILRGILGLGI